MVVMNDTTMKFEIWDTVSQEGYYSLTPMYYRGASVAIIIYDKRIFFYNKILNLSSDHKIFVSLSYNKILNLYIL
ncbi:hypothetical protein ACSBR1_027290 [Camellia fascicularis]